MRQTRGTTDFPILLDPSHPSLDHHRPGGDPLYGTAMSIDTLATTMATELELRQIEPEIADVEVQHPWILKAGIEPIIKARLESQTAENGVIACRASLFSNPSAGDEDTHLRCKLYFAEASAPKTSSLGLAQVLEAPTWRPDEVSAHQIYSVFFHGPAFQLVAGVQALGDRVRSRMAATADTSRLPERARLIEFALQTAGLWELCSSGRMMIPHGIRRIVKVGSLSPDRDRPVFAVVRRGAAPNADQETPGDIDIDVFDEHERPILSIEGYQTVALPFASDTRAAFDLGQKIAQTAVKAA